MHLTRADGKHQYNKYYVLILGGGAGDRAGERSLQLCQTSRGSTYLFQFLHWTEQIWTKDVLSRKHAIMSYSFTSFPVIISSPLFLISL